ncbi:MAG: TIGR03088 family PEP-CTERM/XrtA system glycosyltransferase [Azonexus sp.]|nr:TIGR03088 family PEP-CTERM/XrtA system glycosyltransferase [Azonexus sp.]MDZ4315960.1 TIGR03088 family PEP-CTERM/XrtA system glycosyltransferase [Azonexus sp.]
MENIAPRRRIIHVVHSFSIGGLENVIVQLINRLPADKYEHIVLSLTTISDFKNRIERPDVQFIALDKQPGHAIPLYPKIYRLLRQLKPDVLHTCNLAALELVPLGWLARVPLRIHAEHGWDAHDPNGTNPRYIKVRKLYKPFVSHYISVSQDLDNYLAKAIGIPPQRRSLIANGVDTDRFCPAEGSPVNVEGCPFQAGKHWLLGTVGRLQTVKNQPYLARAFVHLLQQHPEAAERMRLIIIGEGPLRAEVERILQEGNASQYAWLPGPRDDIPEIMRMLDCFTLPSQAEGTSCTLQEAMASGLHCIATAVGGNPALVEENHTGHLVPPDDENAYAEALWHAFTHPEQTTAQGQAARQRALKNFALSSMTKRYEQIF